MPKQKIEIEVELTDGFEVTGEYRAPVRGEWFICTGSFIATQCDDDGCSLARVILRKKYVPPANIKPGLWLVHDFVDDKWHISTDGKHLNFPATWVCENFVPPPTNPYQIPEDH